MEDSKSLRSKLFNMFNKKAPPFSDFTSICSHKKKLFSNGVNQWRFRFANSFNHVRPTTRRTPKSKAMHRSLGLKNDFEVSVYVPRKELQRPTVARGLNWEVMVIDNDREIAAYLPYGRIMISSKYLRNVGLTDAELATVLAHEVAHGLAQHNSGQVVLIAAMLCLALVLTAHGLAQHNSERLVLIAAMLCLALVLPVGSVKLISQIINAIVAFISRRREMEADQRGMMLMATAGYHPRRAVGLFERYGGRESNLMSTHPSGKERANNLRNVKLVRKAELAYDQARAIQQVKEQTRYLSVYKRLLMAFSGYWRDRKSD
ncbi:OLC1v1019080C1 [Oldenlandia corymbosa var. corymbosa]|uniref:OLC1v1019080C1 n=1 Tax=Oldenlandia corymbosa var. corymbosa TaxID=529605 RepID=A0AAV1ED31_OLDCO|nr:OLC1v1019080C1 [Oldenlandia corymbosa var. corymbosa]